MGITNQQNFMVLVGHIQPIGLRRQVCLPGAAQCGRVCHRVGLRHRGLVGGGPGEDGLQVAGRKEFRDDGG